MRVLCVFLYNAASAGRSQKTNYIHKNSWIGILVVIFLIIERNFLELIQYGKLCH